MSILTAILVFSFMSIFIGVCTWYVTSKFYMNSYVPRKLFDQALLDSEKYKILYDQREKMDLANAESQKHQQDQMKLVFENLAEKILGQKEEKLSLDSKNSLSDVLLPFKEKIVELQNKIEQTYHNESRERFALKSELNKIIEAGQKMSVETSNLTRALKGDVKMQGNWGEFILDKVLSVAGLREGEEYIKQGQNLGLKAEDGSSLKPDVIIALPEGKHLVIDAKVSLISYERIVNASTVEDKEEATKQFLQSLYKHIDDLSSKKYHLNEKLLSPDFTILFIPIEGAFAFSMGAESELFSYAWSKSIVIAGPVNLLTTLKTVGSLWKQDRQNRHVLTIAQEAGKLYDKMVLFTEDMLKMGDQLEKAKTSFQLAMNKLTQGKGNVISRMLQLKEMGIKHSKNLPVELTDGSSTINEELE